MVASVPSFRELLDWTEDRVAEPRAAEIAAWVRQDTEAAASVAWIRSFHEGSRLMPLATPPAARRTSLRRAIDDHVRPWAPADYTVGALAVATRGAGTARGTRGAGTGALLDLVFDTELGAVRVTVLPGDAAERAVRVTVGEQAAATLEPGTPRVLLTAADRVRRIADRVSATEFEAVGVPNDVDRIWLTQDRWHIRLSLPDDWHG